MELVLDPKIKTHVLLPITVIMLLVHILRGFVGKWMMKSEAPMLAKNKVRELHHLNRLKVQSSPAGAANNSLCDSEWSARRLALEQRYDIKLGGLKDVLSEEGEGSNSSATLLSQLWPQMKSMALQYIPQPVLLFYMSLFFQGYVVLKLPFHLTSNFKEMLHNSITTPDLNVEYVTAISWYFVNLIGVESLGDITMSMLEYSLNIIGLGSKSYLDCSPVEKIRLSNLQAVDSILSVGGVSQLMNSSPQQNSPSQMPSIPGITQQKAEDLFNQHLQLLKTAKPVSVLNDIETKFLEHFSK